MKRDANTEKNTVVAAVPAVAAPERRVLSAEEAKKLVSKCTDYNDSRSDNRNFKCVEFSGIKFKGEDLSGIEAHYSKFTDCEFEECKFDHSEFYFAELHNCVFRNSSLENCNFSFAAVSGLTFLQCNLKGTDMPFVRGDLSCQTCMWERGTANNGQLKLTIAETNAYGFEANFAKVELDVTGSNLRCSEFNDSTLKGQIVQSDLCRSEFNRADLTDFQVSECAINGIETDEASGVDDLFGGVEDFEDLFNDDDEE